MFLATAVIESLADPNVTLCMTPRKARTTKNQGKHISQNIQVFDSKKSPEAASLTREAFLPSSILHVTLLQFLKEHTPWTHALLATLINLGIMLG